MAKFLIDSDVIIWFLRGKKETIELLRNLQEFGVPGCSPVSIIEVQLGVKNGEAKKTSEFLNSFQIYPVERNIANLAGEYIRKYKKKGVKLEIPDAIIAATCVLHDLILVTYNPKHYHYKGLKIYKI